MTSFILLHLSRVVGERSGYICIEMPSSFMFGILREDLRISSLIRKSLRRSLGGFSGGRVRPQGSVNPVAGKRRQGRVREQRIEQFLYCRKQIKYSLWDPSHPEAFTSFPVVQVLQVGLELYHSFRKGPVVFPEISVG